jgi:hypothetical protein
MSNKLTLLQVDALTGIETIRDLTEDELDDLAIVAQSTQVLEQEQAEKITARTSALAKLAALGLTEEEIAAL